MKRWHHVLRTWLGIALAAQLAGCFTPPLLGGDRIEDPGLALEKHLSRYPGRLEVRALRFADPASPPDGVHVEVAGGPLVVHFLPSGLSLVDEETGFARIATQLADLGLGSLAFEYPGVGLSRANKRPDELRAFASAVLERARELAPGRPLIVRGTSLGSLVGASALESEPGIVGAVLIAPVRPSTVVPRFARAALWWLPGTLVAPFFRRPDLTDPLTVEDVAPLFVVASPGDPLLSEKEFVRLEEAAERSGGASHRTPPGLHVFPVRYSGCLAPGESSFLRDVLAPYDPEFERRFAALLTNAFALEGGALTEFRDALGPDAFEVGIDLLVLHGAGERDEPFDLLPRNEDGTPIAKELWIPTLHQTRALALASPVLRSFVLGILLQARSEADSGDAKDGGAEDRGPGAKIRTTFEGWPFREELVLELERGYDDSTQFRAVLEWLAGPVRASRAELDAGARNGPAASGAPQS